MTGSDWRHRAVCRDEDAELFFPTGNTGPALLQAEEAKGVCRTCPVMGECGEWALAHGREAEHGVWGGMSEGERRTVLRRRARDRNQDKTTGPAPAPSNPKRGPVTCGTRGGYEKHRREGTPYCGPCTVANTESDRLLHATGSRVAVAS